MRLKQLGAMLSREGPQIGRPWLPDVRQALHGKLSETYSAWPERGWLNGEGDVFVDAWGRPVILIVDGDQIIGVASRGPDGVWEGGRGDAIVTTLDSLPPATQPATGNNGGKP